MTLRVFEAFAGIGAQRKALKKNKQNFKIIGMAEWYVPAIVSYQAIHNNMKIKPIDHNNSLEAMSEYLSSLPLSMDSKNLVNKNYWKNKKLDELRIIYKAVKLSEKEGNIFNVELLHKRKLSDVDLLTYSFPCQDLSQQGNQKGMKKGENTRSGLLWEIEKALKSTPKQELPRYLLMENVSALLNKNFKHEFHKWVKVLEKFGYKNSYGILNSANFGSPQARRRAFMISSLKTQINLPKGNKNPRSLKSILDKEPESKYFIKSLDKYDLSDFKKTKSNINKSKLINYSTFNSEAYVYDPNYTGPTLTASGANSRIKIRYNGKIRKMNAREAFLYMGFSLKDFNSVNNLGYLNETKMIYTCGNSISVEVLESIMKLIGDNYEK